MYFFCIFAICITEYITISAISIVNVTLKTDDSKYDLAILTFALTWELVYKGEVLATIDLVSTSFTDISTGHSLVKPFAGFRFA